MMEENNEDVPKVSDTSQEATSRRASDTIYLKVLVPSIAAGAIIGKNGEAIGQMQRETGAKIKLSKLNDFYPGTTERVCLIQGPLTGVRAMHNYIMDRILEKPEISAPAVTPSGHIALPQAAEAPAIAAPGYALWPLAAVCTTGAQPLSTNRLLWERHKQVKILVPNCTAGLVIGKQGSYVSEIKEATGAFIQISQKSKDINLPERCITIAGEADQLRSAVDMVLTKIAEDPQSGTCPTISYSHAQGPVASAYPTGSPFAYTTPPPPPTPQAQTLLSSRHPAAAATAAIVRQKSDGGIPMTGAYYHNALQATYFAAAAAAAAAAADYQQRLAAAGYQQQQHRGMEAVHSGEASGASSSLESGGGGGGGGGFVGPLTPPVGEQDVSSSFYTTPLLPASQMILQSPAAATPFALLQPNAVAAGGMYASPTGLESPLDPSSFPLVASSPPPPPSASSLNTFGGSGSGVTAAFFPPLRTSSPLSTTPATTATAAWLRSRGFSEEAVAEITHAMSTLSAHGVLNISAVAPSESMHFVRLRMKRLRLRQLCPVERILETHKLGDKTREHAWRASFIGHISHSSSSRLFSPTPPPHFVSIFPVERFHFSLSRSFVISRLLLSSCTSLSLSLPDYSECFTQLPLPPSTSPHPSLFLFVRLEPEAHSLLATSPLPHRDFHLSSI
ncbi:RNA-binding protein Nova-1 [Echinococcus granulosus]|nr:RNA-binding protein Nova-1 [Echinococcus granulosus]